MKKVLFLIFMSVFCQLIGADDILIEAGAFDNKGGRVVDQQFMDQMGSPYLMAHGLDVPVEDASPMKREQENKDYPIIRNSIWEIY